MVFMNDFQLAFPAAGCVGMGSWVDQGPDHGWQQRRQRQLIKLFKTNA